MLEDLLRNEERILVDNEAKLEELKAEILQQRTYIAGIKDAKMELDEKFGDYGPVFVDIRRLNIIRVIKYVRETWNIGLKEAKQIVEFLLPTGRTGISTVNDFDDFLR